MTTPPASDMQPTSGKAIAALVTGIASFLLCIYWFISIPGAIVAVVLGVLGRKETADGTRKGGGMALTGIILGAVTVVLIGGLLLLSAIAPDLFKNSDWFQQVCEQQPDNQFCK